MSSDFLKAPIQNKNKEKIEVKFWSGVSFALLVSLELKRKD